MKFEELEQLLYITHIDNLGSILEQGILSHSKVVNVPHKRIDMLAVQERRRAKRVFGGGRLHDYANLYFSARNPMLFKRKDEHKDLCVLRVNKEVLKIPGVVVTTCNAASDYTSFNSAESGIEKLDRKMIFAKNWTDDDPILSRKKRAAKCAEVLVPHRVPPSLIFGAYVSCKENQDNLAKRYPSLAINLNPTVFFLE